MLPVVEAIEPASFDQSVRQKGKKWIEDNHFDPDLPIPTGKTLKPYWTICLPELREKYLGICAYSCFYIHPIAGAASVDHFAAKSKKLSLAYEWSNYRLVCSRMNARKNHFDDVLDPFTLSLETFYLDFVTGAPYPNPEISSQLITDAEKTIKRLKLDDPDINSERLKGFDRCKDGNWSTSELQRVNPFVHFEASRQGLL